MLVIALTSTHLTLLAMMSLLSRGSAAILATTGTWLELLLLHHCSLVIVVDGGWICLILYVLPVYIAHLYGQLALRWVWNAEDGLGCGTCVDHQVAR